jgi:two-component system, response regulator PdtaR
MIKNDVSSEELHAGLVLVVEDEFFIAMDLEATLTKAGYRVLGPAATVMDALKLLCDHDPDAALLDVNLGNHRVTPVAQE